MIKFAQQRGAMTILISLVLLTLITFVALFTAKTVVFEKKIAGNDVRSKSAFEAAQAGLDAAVAYTSNGFDQDGDAQDTLDTNIFNANGTVSVDGSGTTNVATFSQDPSSNQSSVTVTMVGDDASANNITAVTITSTGTSADGTASRTISTTISTTSPIVSPPKAPLKARAKVSFSGNAAIYNPEGIWAVESGGIADVESGSVNIYNSIDKSISFADGDYDSAVYQNQQHCGNNTGEPTIDCSTDGGVSYYGCPGTQNVKCPINLESESGSGAKIPGNLTLSSYSGDQLFFKTFGVTKEKFKTEIADEVIDGDDWATLDKVTNKIIWVDGDTPNGAHPDIGCSENIDDRKHTLGNGTPPALSAFVDNCADAGGELGPVLIVVDGNLDSNGGHLFGLIYVTGDSGVNGNIEFQGALIIEGENGGARGGPVIWYDSSILSQLDSLGGKAATSGTWRDF